MRTLIIIKNDAVKRHLGTAILHRIEASYFELIQLKMMTPSRHQVERHYIEHKDSEHYTAIVDTLAEKRCVFSVVEHREFPLTTVSRMRDMIGPYKNRIPGTIRGDYALSDRDNSIHGSSSEAAAYYEIGLWFHAETIREKAEFTANTKAFNACP